MYSDKLQHKNCMKTNTKNNSDSKTENTRSSSTDASGNYDYRVNEKFGILKTIKLFDPIEKREEMKSETIPNEYLGAASTLLQAEIDGLHRNNSTNNSNTQKRTDENQYGGNEIIDFENCHPKLDLDDPTLLIGLPSDVFINASSFSPPDLHEDIFEIGKDIYVWISDLYSPSKFWFNIDEPNLNVEFEGLMESLNDFLNDVEGTKEYHMRETDVLVGRACAALYKWRWHRAEIVSPLDPETNQAKVFFIDYGTTSEVKLAHLRHLSLTFITMPRQAIRGRLAFVTPKNIRWEFDGPNDATKCMIQFATKQMMYAKIYAYEETEHVFHLLLYNIGTDTVPYCVNKKMADYDFCTFLAPNNDVFPISEDVYPSFDMLEKGISPSYVDILQKEIERPEPPIFDMDIEKKRFKRIIFGISPCSPCKRVNMPRIKSDPKQDDEYLSAELPPPYMNEWQEPFLIMTNNTTINSTTQIETIKPNTPPPPYVDEWQTTFMAINITTNPETQIESSPQNIPDDCNCELLIPPTWLNNPFLPDLSPKTRHRLFCSKKPFK